MKICIDPGHGGNDPGALGRQSKEKDINLALASKLEQKLTKSGIQVVMTRTSDATLDLQQRCDIANKGNCDYFMSIHCNSFNNASAAGTEAYYYKGSKAGQELAGKILNAAVESGHLKNRGVKTAGFYVLKFTKMPAVLLETAFISNPDEEKLLRNDSWQDGVMKNIAIAVCNYLKITPNVEDILYRVLNQGVQVGAFKIKENAIRLAEEVLAEISSGNVKVVASNGVIIFDKVKEPESSNTGPVSDAAVHPITDLRRASAEQMESFLHKINPNAPYIAQKYIDMGMKEGIRGDIAFAQAIKETNYFRFTGSVKAEQNNFAGLGSISAGNSGASFKTVDEGILAHIQHLKAYANTEPLKTSLLDPRFNLVKRGTAPGFEDLDGKWAVPGSGYGQSIINIWRRILDEPVSDKNEDSGTVSDVHDKIADKKLIEEFQNMIKELSNFVEKLKGIANNKE